MRFRYAARGPSAERKESVLFFAYPALIPRRDDARHRKRDRAILSRPARGGTEVLVLVAFSEMPEMCFISLLIRFGNRAILEQPIRVEVTGSLKISGQRGDRGKSAMIKGPNAKEKALRPVGDRSVEMGLELCFQQECLRGVGFATHC